MIEEKISRESFNLVQKELITLTEKLENMNTALDELNDLKSEIKGIKIFLGRKHSDFSEQFQDIMKKIMKK
jgi:predicted urease superfamily metal-dependent hydrolase